MFLPLLLNSAKKHEWAKKGNGSTFADLFVNSWKYCIFSILLSRKKDICFVVLVGFRGDAGTFNLVISSCVTKRSHITALTDSSLVDFHLFSKTAPYKLEIISRLRKELNWQKSFGGLFAKLVWIWQQLLTFFWEQKIKSEQLLAVGPLTVSLCCAENDFSAEWQTNPTVAVCVKAT